MSLPCFPENCLTITKEQAFTMLLGSIAMEELALSHILNAEGEKLQYVLGTLPGCQSPSATPAEVLEVNQSISDLLERVTQSQLLLKGKLAQVLDAIKADSICPEEKSICILCSPACTRWCCDTPLSWNLIYCVGKDCFWKECCPFNIYLPKGKCFLLCYSFQIESCSSSVFILLKAFQNGCWKEFPICTSEKSITPSSFCGSLPLNSDCCIPTLLVFCLKKPCQITVKQAMLTLVEV